MPTIEETLDDIILRLDENVVVVAGIRTDTNTARTRADQAVINIADVRVDVRAYTDQRIQYVLDLLVNQFTEWAESVLAAANGYADGVGTGVGNGITAGLDAWKTTIEATLADMIGFYENISTWAQDTFDVEIPAILAEIAQHTEELRAAEQDILNNLAETRSETSEMASRWRELADGIEDAKNRIIEMDFSIYAIKDEIYRNIAVEFDGRFANYDERITVAAGEMGAVATKVEELEVTIGENTALVQNLEIALIEGDEQLAQQITALSVGTNTQFDPAQIWHFDSTSEGWSGSWDNGEVVVADSTQSPVISVDASRYRQVRARIRRIGSPTWNASLNWTGATPAGPVIIDEPVWSGDIAEITINPAWAGTLTRMTLTLSSGSDASNRYFLDWVTVGRPAPGASSAQLDSERIARINADGTLAGRLDAIETRFVTGDGITEIAQDVIDGVRSEIIADAVSGAVTAINTDITSMETRLNDIESGQTVTNNAVSLLTNSITVIDGTIETLNSRVDAFETSLDNLATSTAFAALVQRVEETETGITSTNEDVVLLNTTIATQEGNISTAQALAQGAANLAGSKGKVFVQPAEPASSERLAQNLWIDTTDGNNTPKRWDGDSWEAVTDKVARDAAQAAADALAGLGDKASASALSALTQRVETSEGLLSSQSQDLVSLSSSLVTVSDNVTTAQQAANAAATLAGGKGKVIVRSAAPVVADRLAQNLWIDITSGNNTPKRWDGSNWVAVTDKVALDAAAAAALALNQISSKADASAVTALTTRVQETEDGISSIGSDLTVINNSIGVVAGDVVTAQQAAQAAANAAGAKGRVYFQDTAPPIAARLPQNLWINTAGGANQPRRWNGTTWVPVTDKVAQDALAAAEAAQEGLTTKASASSVSSLEQRVSDDHGILTSTTSRVDTVENRINNTTTGLSGLSTRISAVNTRVNDTNGVINAVANSIDALEVNVGRYSANGLFRVRATATPTGAQSRIALVASATAGEGNTRTAGIYLEAIGGGDSRMVVEANNFAVVQDGGTTRTRFIPFYIANGIIYMKTAFIEDATIGTLKLGNNSVTIQWSANARSVTINCAYACKLIVVTYARIVGTNARHTTRYRIYRNNVAFDNILFSVNEYTYPYTTLHMLTVPAGAHTFRFDFVRDGTGEATQDVDPKIAVFGAYR